MSVRVYSTWGEKTLSVRDDVAFQRCTLVRRDYSGVAGDRAATCQAILNKFIKLLRGYLPYTLLQIWN